MPLTPWQQAAIECLQEFSDIEAQRQSWLHTSGPWLGTSGPEVLYPSEYPIHVAGELCCQLFDDTSLGDMLKSGEVFFSPECDALLRGFERKIDAVDVEQGASSLLEDPAWLEIVSMAKVILLKIKSLTEGEDTMESRLPAEWREVANDLGLEIVSPYEVILPSGSRIRAPVLVRHFGGPKGMLVVADYSESLRTGWAEEAVQAGYGFSVLGEPSDEYDRDVFIEVLSDWGWHGPESERPAWLTLVDPEAE